MPTRVIYLHGLGGSPEDWRAVQARQPGIALPLGGMWATPEEGAASVAQTVLQEAPGTITLCGYSMGGRIALLAAEKLVAMGEKPDGLILISAGFGESSSLARAQRLERDLAWASDLERNPENFWEKWYGQELFASYRALSAEQRAQWMENRKSIDNQALAAQLRNLGPGRHDDLFPRLRQLVAGGLRVLYLAGELDKKYGELSRKVGELPGAAVELIPGAGHILPLEAPAALALRISRFVK